jgi:hypothetical protein
MDSSAIYVNASTHLVPGGDYRWNLAPLERHAYLSGLVQDMMQWKWCDFQTGETLAPAIDEPPKLPELSKWMPDNSNTSWDDFAGVDLEVNLSGVYEARHSDCVLVYKYA